MKAIVSKVLFGGIFGCLIFNNPALANEPIKKNIQPEVPKSEILATRAYPASNIPIVPQIFDYVDRILTVNKSDSLQIALDSNARTILQDNFSSNLNFTHNRTLSLDQLPYSHQAETGNLTLGFQKTFWPTKNSQKYWGLTTVKHWGQNDNKQLHSPQASYGDSAITLPSGSSALTVSGGGNQNLVQKVSSPGEFKDFRGGVAFHSGIARNVTMGVGFVYENSLVGFSQLTYQSDRFPMRTTVSVLTGKLGLEVHSHLRFQPAANFVLNYYNDKEKQKFDLDWGVIPGLTLTARGNSKEKSLTTGVKIAVHNEYLSLSAKAELDNNQNWQWNFNSQIGRFQLIYGRNLQKINSELNVNLMKFESSGFQCSAFVKYETQENKKRDEYLTVWGGRLHSGEKIGNNQYRWAFDLGYGFGSQGQGAIASASAALNPNLSLKLTYQQVSTVSDDTNIKLQLNSK